MGQVPDRRVRFFFEVGRTIIWDAGILKVGLEGLGAWTAINALATEWDGEFLEAAAIRLLQAMGEQDHGAWPGAVVRETLFQSLIDAGLVIQADRDDWWAVAGWPKYQTYDDDGKPKSPAAIKQARYRQRKAERNGVTPDVTVLRNGNGPVTERNSHAGASDSELGTRNSELDDDVAQAQEYAAAALRVTMSELATRKGTHPKPKARA